MVYKMVRVTFLLGYTCTISRLPLRHSFNTSSHSADARKLILYVGKQVNCPVEELQTHGFNPHESAHFCLWQIQQSLRLLRHHCPNRQLPPLVHQNRRSTRFHPPTLHAFLHVMIPKPPPLLPFLPLLTRLFPCEFLCIVPGTSPGLQLNARIRRSQPFPRTLLQDPKPSCRPYGLSGACGTCRDSHGTGRMQHACGTYICSAQLLSRSIKAAAARATGSRFSSINSPQSSIMPSCSWNCCKSTPQVAPSSRPRARAAFCFASNVSFWSCCVWFCSNCTFSSRARICSSSASIWLNTLSSEVGIDADSVAGSPEAGAGTSGTEFRKSNGCFVGPVRFRPIPFIICASQSSSSDRDARLIIDFIWSALRFAAGVTAAVDTAGRGGTLTVSFRSRIRFATSATSDVERLSQLSTTDAVVTATMGRFFFFFLTKSLESSPPSSSSRRGLRGRAGAAAATAVDSSPAASSDVARCRRSSRFLNIQSQCFGTFGGPVPITEPSLFRCTNRGAKCTSLDFNIFYVGFPFLMKITQLIIWRSSSGPDVDRKNFLSMDKDRLRVAVYRGGRMLLSIIADRIQEKLLQIKKNTWTSVLIFLSNSMLTMSARREKMLKNCVMHGDCTAEETFRRRPFFFLDIASSSLHFGCLCVATTNTFIHRRSFLPSIPQHLTQFPSRTSISFVAHLPVSVKIAPAPPAPRMIGESSRTCAGCLEPQFANPQKASRMSEDARTSSGVSAPLLKLRAYKARVCVLASSQFSRLLIFPCMSLGYGSVSWRGLFINTFWQGRLTADEGFRLRFSPSFDKREMWTPIVWSPPGNAAGRPITHIVPKMFEASEGVRHDSIKECKMLKIDAELVSLRSTNTSSDQKHNNRTYSAGIGGRQFGWCGSRPPFSFPIFLGHLRGPPSCASPTDIYFLHLFPSRSISWIGNDVSHSTSFCGGNETAGGEQSRVFPPVAIKLVVCCTATASGGSASLSLNSRPPKPLASACSSGESITRRLIDSSLRMLSVEAYSIRRIWFSSAPAPWRHIKGRNNPTFCGRSRPRRFCSPRFSSLAGPDRQTLGPTGCRTEACQTRSIVLRTLSQSPR
eukprot:284816564_2